MEPTPSPPPEPINACPVCKNPEFDPSYVSRICNDCRTQLLKINAPLWVKALAVAIIALTIVGLFLLPRNMKIAVHIERAKAAESEHRYFTASREYEIISATSHNVENKVRLFHAYFMNHDYPKAIPLIESFAGTKTEDNTLAYYVNCDISLLDEIYGDTTLGSLLPAGLADSSKVKILYSYTQDHPRSLAAFYLLANSLFDLQRYEEADVAAGNVIEINNTWGPAYSLLAAIARERRQFDRANSYYDQMLEFNAEDLTAITGKARVALKQHQDEKAAELIAQGKALNPEDAVVQESDVLSLFLTGKKAEATQALIHMKQTCTADDSVVYERTRKVVAGEIIYR